MEESERMMMRCTFFFPLLLLRCQLRGLVLELLDRVCRRVDLASVCLNL